MSAIEERHFLEFIPPMTTEINRHHLLALYRALQRSATKFSSYNFRHYFLRRNRLAFREFLGVHPVGQPSSDSKASNPANLNAFYKEQRNQLDIVSRAAAVNRMFEGERLVVERPRIITSGGGAGMEASAVSNIIYLCIVIN